MRFLVAGSKRWEDVASVRRHLYALEPSVLIHGGDDGACSIADTIARMRLCIPVHVGEVSDLDRDRLGSKKARLIRDAMLLAHHKPDRGLAFGSLWWLHEGKPPHHVTFWERTITGEMVARMLRAGLPVRWICAPSAEAIDLVEMPTPDEQERRKATAKREAGGAA